jgi:hypothetical protein
MKTLAFCICLSLCLLPVKQASAQTKPSSSHFTLGISSWDSKWSYSVGFTESLRPDLDVYLNATTQNNQRDGLLPPGQNYLDWQGRSNSLYELGLQKRHALGKLQLMGGLGFQAALHTVQDPRDYDRVQTLSRRNQIAPRLGMAYQIGKVYLQLSATTAPRPMAGLPDRTTMYTFSLGMRR